MGSLTPYACLCCAWCQLLGAHSNHEGRSFSSNRSNGLTSIEGRAFQAEGRMGGVQRKVVMSFFPVDRKI